VDVETKPSGRNQPAEHFLRRQVVPRRASRRVWKAMLRWAGALAGLAGVVAAGFWTAAAAGRAPELAVSRIRVEGNVRLAEGEILEALGLHPGSNILNLDLEVLKRQLLRSPWVKDVQLTRVLPATLTLRIVERAPIGVAVLDRLYLMDGEGIFLDEMGPRYADLAPPLVRGLMDETGRVVVERAELAGRVLQALAEAESVGSAVSEIDVAGGRGSIRVHLRHPALTLLLEEDDLVDRLREILPLSEAILDRFPTLLAVDLRYENRVYLQLPRGEFGKGEVTPDASIHGGR
jgi:cell division septal protein FtsQ